MNKKESAEDPLAAYIELLGQSRPTADTRAAMLEAIKRDQAHRFRMDWVNSIIALVNTLLAVTVFIAVMIIAQDLSQNPETVPQVWRILASATAFSTALIGGSYALNSGKRRKK